MRKLYPIFSVFTLLLAALLLVGSCGMQSTTEVLYNKTVRDSIAQQYVKSALAKKLKSKSTFDVFKFKKGDALGAEVNKFYQYTKNDLGWQNTIARGGSEQINKLVSLLESASDNGMKATKYQLPKIKDLVNRLYAPNIPESPDHLENMVELDVLLTGAALTYVNDVKSGMFKGGSRWIVPKKEMVTGEELIKAVRYGGIEKMVNTFAPTHKSYVGLRDKLKQYKSIADKGGWKKIPSQLSKGQSGKKVSLLAARLAASGDLDAALATAAKYGDKMTAAVKKYQKRNGLVVTGSVNEKTLTSLNKPIEDRIKLIELNMERHRWLPHADSLGGRYVWVNLPEYIIRVFDEGKQVADIVGVVGEPKNATPILVDRPMRSIIFSPVWNIPSSIAKEEMEFILRNPAVLIVADVDVFLDGTKVDPRSVDWKTINTSRIRMRQRPKKTNSMGLCKFGFDNDYSIFLHDTPNKPDFKAHYRAKSHGCIRVGEPQRLAEVLLKGSKWSSGGINSAMKSGKETYAKLPKDVRVHLVYFTAWVDAAGELQFRSDIYGHDRRHFKTLASL